MAGGDPAKLALVESGFAACGIPDTAGEAVPGEAAPAQDDFVEAPAPAPAMLGDW